jgi:hypothetical protein
LLHILILPPFLDLSTRRKTFETAAERSSLRYKLSQTLFPDV